MNSRIIVDSCLDYNSDIEWLQDIYRVPFRLIVDDDEIIDDNIDTKELLSKMKQKKSIIKSACPSPQDFLKRFVVDGDSYVVTISGNLSGSYNSAELAKSMFLEQHPNSRIHIFNSRTAASGEALIALRINELLGAGIDFDSIVKQTEAYIKSINTLFILSSLDNLAKNGRISLIKAKLASILHIVPILCGDKEGHIDLKEQIRGKKRAYARLVEIIGEVCTDTEDRVVGITYVNAYEKAVELKNEISSNYNFKDILLLEGGGLSTLYADDGGIIVTF